MIFSGCSRTLVNLRSLDSPILHLLETSCISSNFPFNARQLLLPPSAELPRVYTSAASSPDRPAITTSPGAASPVLVKYRNNERPQAHEQEDVNDERCVSRSRASMRSTYHLGFVLPTG